MDILQIPILSDNYSYILYDSITKKTACVDPAEPEPILNELEKKKFFFRLYIEYTSSLRSYRW